MQRVAARAAAEADPARSVVVGVVIPYFQREPGILRRALDSVLAQNLPGGTSTRVWVIDDGSPHPAAHEMPPESDTAGVEIRLIRQTNGGPGAARNAGLDAALDDGDVGLIAFLDSDDTWTPDHLADALSALDRGYDFYCCDNARPGSFERFSEDVPVLRGAGAAIAGKSVLLSPDGPVRGFAPHALDDEFVTGYLSHTSTVVMRAEAVGGIRFDPDLRSAGEDRMFWLSVALSGAAVAISWRCNVHCGTGINLFFSAYDWNAPGTIERIGSQLLFAEKLRRHPALNTTRRTFAETRTRDRRRAYGFLFVRALLKRNRPPLGALRRLLRFDPLLPLRMPVLFLFVLRDPRPEARQF